MKDELGDWILKTRPRLPRCAKLNTFNLCVYVTVRLYVCERVQAVAFCKCAFGCSIQQRTVATTPLALYTQGGPQTGATAQLAGWRRMGRATWAGALSICLESLFIRLSLLEATQCNTPC